MRGGERTGGDRDRCRTRVEETQYHKRHNTSRRTQKAFKEARRHTGTLRRARLFVRRVDIRETHRRAHTS